MPFGHYLLRKSAWYAGALILALFLNFFLPRLLPGNPVDAIVAGLGRGGSAGGEQLRRVHEAYTETFGLDRPIWEQLRIYVTNLFHGELGVSFALYPAPVSELIGEALPWTVALQLPAIVVGWIVGNAIGAFAAYRGGLFDRGAFLGSLVLSSIPYYCLAVLLLYGLAVAWPVFPPSGGYGFGNTPALSVHFLVDAVHHYWLPFLSLVLVFIGSQAIGMRSTTSHEMQSDYIAYSRGLGLRDRTIVRYAFRNGVLPQVTGLAVSIGGLIAGSLLTELVFSYPGLGTLMFSSIRQNDFPVIAGIALLITVVVLLANYLVEVAYGVIDPRIRASQSKEL